MFALLRFARRPEEDNKKANRKNWPTMIGKARELKMGQVDPRRQDCFE